jgi:hypothetical protein
VILQMVARAGFLASALLVNSRFLNIPSFLIFAVIIPALLLLLTIPMVVLIFAKAPAAKPYGITICILNLLAQIYAVIRLITVYVSHPTLPFSVLSITISIAYVTVFTLALIFLIRWPVSDAGGPPPLPTGVVPTGVVETSHRGLAQASLICAICGPLAMVILGPVALGLGIAARRKMSKSKNFDGAGMALAGIIIGAIETVVAVPLVLLAIVTLIANP